MGKESTNCKIERIKLNITQGELSCITGISRSTIVKIEKGELEGIRFGILVRLAIFFGKTIDSLFFYNLKK